MKEKIKWGLLALETFMICGVSAFPAFAGNVNGQDNLDLDWLKSKSNGTFDSATDSFKGIFSSAYGFIVVVSSALMVLFLILAAVTYAGGSARAKDEAKGKILGVFVGAFIVFASLAIISLIGGIATGAFTS